MNAGAVVIWDPVTKWPYVLIYATKAIAKASAVCGGALVRPALSGCDAVLASGLPA